MRTISFLILIISLSCIFSNSAYSQQEEKCMFNSSLHYTVNGMKYWYDKSQGGLETITDVPYDNLKCKNCHISNCDVCHKTDKDGKAVYSTAAAKNQDICLKCHAREASMMKIDKKNNTEDVHFASGMKCMDCHTAREMHGDGTEYTSMKQQGAMDVNCEQCHDKISKTRSHTIHRNKLDCKSCHVQHVVSCTNCHFETMVKEAKRVAVPVTNWEFLINYNGKVTSANMQTFVVEGNKTFLIFAPQFSHSVSKEGKKCEECHNTSNDNKIEKGSIELTWLKDEKIEQAKGVIPIVDGVNYNSVFQNYENGNWIPIENPVSPKIQYVNYGKPLTKSQLNKLLRTQKSK